MGCRLPFDISFVSVAIGNEGCLFTRTLRGLADVEHCYKSGFREAPVAGVARLCSSSLILWEGSEIRTAVKNFAVQKDNSPLLKGNLKTYFVLFTRVSGRIFFGLCEWAVWKRGVIIRVDTLKGLSTCAVD